MKMSRKVSMTIALCFVFSALFSFAAFANLDQGQDTYELGPDYTDFVSSFEEEFDDEEVAEEAEPVQMVYDYFDFDDGDMIEKAEKIDVNQALFNGFNTYDFLFINEQLKDFDVLQLSTGFNKQRITTFSEVKYVEGQADQGTVVGTMVFHIDEALSVFDDVPEKNVIITQDSLTAVGASGLFSETIQLDYIGINYVLMAVYHPEMEAPAVKMFKVCREQEVTRVLLENVQINFFEEEEEEISLESFVPGIMDFGF